MAQLTLDVQVEARAQLARIKQHWNDFWFELKDFNDQGRWRALGYLSFSACVETELGLSHQRASQLLQAASVTLVLGPQKFLPNESQARALAPLSESPVELISTWAEVVEGSPARADGSPKLTAADVHQAVERRQPKPHAEVWAERRETAAVATAERMATLDLGDLYDRIDHCDALTYLATKLEPASVNVCVTSPPYWAKRRYLPAEPMTLRANLTPEECAYVQAELQKVGVR